MRLIIINKKTLLAIILALVLLVLTFVLYLIYNKTEETFNPDVYYQGNVDEKVVAFACNVDWGNEFIQPMIDIFKAKNLKITYFVTGKWAEKNQDFLKIIHDEKHEIGNHGYSHIDYDKLSYDRNKEEITKAHNIIKNTLNIEPIYFAPPSGAYNDNTVKAAKELGYDLIMWSIDTIDWRKDSTRDIIVKRVTEKIHNSAIILMHPTAETVKALPEIINYLYQNGYKIGTISDVIKNKE